MSPSPPQTSADVQLRRRHKRLTSWPQGGTNSVVQFKLQSSCWDQADTSHYLRTPPYLAFYLLSSPTSPIPLLLRALPQ